MRRFLSIGLLCFLLATSGCATKAVREVPWVVVKSPRFEILSSLSAEEAQRLASELERFHALIYALTSAPSFESPIPTKIFVFKKLRNYKKYGPSGSAGAFDGGVRSNVMVLADASNKAGALEISLHEYTHYVLDNGAGFEYPIWYNEGFAELMSSARTLKDMVAVGEIPKSRIPSFQYGVWMPIHRVVSATGYDSVQPNELHMLYAEAWALVHYLMLDRPNSGSTQAQMTQYIRLVESGLEPTEAFEEAFEDRASEVGLKIQQILERGRTKLRVIGVPIKNLDYDKTAPSVRIPDASEVAVRLGQLQLRFGEGADAEADFRAAIAAAPENPAALAGLGDALKFQKKFDLAEPYFRKAAELAPDDVLIQLDLAEFFHDRALEATSRVDRSRDLMTAREIYSRCRKLDDRIPEPWLMEGRTHLVPGEDTRLAVPLIDRALEILPSSRDTIYSLAEAHVALGQEKLAAKLLARAFSSQMDSGAQKGTAERIEAIKKAREELAAKVK